jgi:hypothetical protein
MRRPREPLRDHKCPLKCSPDRTGGPHLQGQCPSSLQASPAGNQNGPRWNIATRWFWQQIPLDSTGWPAASEQGQVRPGAADADPDLSFTTQESRIESRTCLGILPKSDPGHDLTLERLTEREGLTFKVSVPHLSKLLPPGIRANLDGTSQRGGFGSRCRRLQPDGLNG